MILIIFINYFNIFNRSVRLLVDFSYIITFMPCNKNKNNLFCKYHNTFTLFPGKRHNVSWVVLSLCLPSCQTTCLASDQRTSWTSLLLVASRTFGQPALAGNISLFGATWEHWIVLYFLLNTTGKMAMKIKKYGLVIKALLNEFRYKNCFILIIDR